MARFHFLYRNVTFVIDEIVMVLSVWYLVTPQLVLIWKNSQMSDFVAVNMQIWAVLWDLGWLWYGHFVHVSELTLNPPEGIIAGPINEENFFEWEALIT